MVNGVRGSRSKGDAVMIARILFLTIFAILVGIANIVLGGPLSVGGIVLGLLNTAYGMACWALIIGPEYRNV